MNIHPLAVRSMRFYLKAVRRLRGLFGRGESRDMSRMVPFYRKIWSEAAAEVGADFAEIGPDLWQIALDGKTTIIHNFRTALDNPVVLHLAGDKAICYRLLSESGLPVPEHLVFGYRDIHLALDFMTKHPDCCFIIKPASGTSGSAGVTTHIRNARQCLAAVALASLYHDKVLIERQIFGETYRFLILDGKALHATKRKGLIVVGDGRSTVRELVEKESGRQQNGSPVTTVGDPAVTAECACQGVAPESVPAKNRRILIRAQVSAPGIPQELRTVFTDDASADMSEVIWQQAKRAAAALDVTFAGVDIVTIDPSVPLEQSNGAIIEVNTTPGLHHHYRDGKSLGDSPTVAIVEYLLQHAPFRGRPKQGNN